MKLYSTKNIESRYTLKEAVLKGLPEDNGLFMPVEVPKLSKDFLKNIESHSFQSIGYEICKTLFQGAIPEEDLKKIVEQSINFPAPLVKLNGSKYVLELFHGPSLAFKDFGARFMAQLMSYFNRKEEEELVILVATSGDTGGAVASGFYDTPGVKVVILYPSGKVSELQEKQLTTMGKNITAIEVDGTFDDCQTLVKQAFLDKELNKSIRLSSANSINIARLIPQSFYYFEAYKQLPSKFDQVVFSVPSGNFGNLTAGLMAKKMGLDIFRFLAATNANDVVPSYLKTGSFVPRKSVRTLSNAMDVGNPSNFHRMSDWFNLKKMQNYIVGYSFDDEATKKGIQEVYERHNYEIDPHGAIAYLAYSDAIFKFSSMTQGIILETAHPSKFKDTMEKVLKKEIEVPERLAILADKQKKSIKKDTSFDGFKQWLMTNYA